MNISIEQDFVFIYNSDECHLQPDFSFGHMTIYQLRNFILVVLVL